MRFCPEIRPYQGKSRGKCNVFRKFLPYWLFLLKKHATLFVFFEENGCLWGEGQWLGLSVCRRFYLDCSNLGEKLCDEWVLSASVCGTGSFSAHTATHSINESAHETQSFSPKSRNPNKPQNSILNNFTSCFTIEP